MNAALNSKLETEAYRWTKIPGTEYEVSLVDVTPEMALEWLRENRCNNRNVSDKGVADLIEELEADRWLISHQGIAFDVDEVLIDGQHRLTAIAESGITASLLVWKNVPHEVFEITDRGIRRDFVQVLHTAGHKSNIAIANVVKLVCNLENGYHRSYTPLAIAKIEASLLKHQRTLELIYEHCKGAPKMFRLTNHNVVFAVFLAYLQDPERTLQFVAQYRSGHKIEQGDAAGALREYVSSRHGTKNELRPQQLYTRMAFCLSKWLEKQQVRAITAQYVASGLGKLILGSGLCEEFHPSFLQEGH